MIPLIDKTPVASSQSSLSLLVRIHILIKYGAIIKIKPETTRMYIFEIKYGTIKREIPVRSGIAALCFLPYIKYPRPIAPHIIPQISCELPSIKISLLPLWINRAWPCWTTPFSEGPREPLWCSFARQPGCGSCRSSSSGFHQEYHWSASQWSRRVWDPRSSTYRQP